MIHEDRCCRSLNTLHAINRAVCNMWRKQPLRIHMHLHCWMRNRQCTLVCMSLYNCFHFLIHLHFSNIWSQQFSTAFYGIYVLLWRKGQLGSEYNVCEKKLNILLYAFSGKTASAAHDTVTSTKSITTPGKNKQSNFAVVLACFDAMH